jgi:DNA mismatch endonuclease (patch repair protein)
MPLQLPNPAPSSDNARNTMRANRGSDTGPERRVRAALRAAGLSGYRLNWRKAPGRPDVAYPGRKVAVFVHGCFWHRCPRCNPPNPKAHSEFWTRKFELNVERDARKRAQLEDAGWVVLVIWECDVRERLPESVARVAEMLAARPAHRVSRG